MNSRFVLWLFLFTQLSFISPSVGAGPTSCGGDTSRIFLHHCRIQRQFEAAGKPEQGPLPFLVFAQDARDPRARKLEEKLSAGFRAVPYLDQMLKDDHGPTRNKALWALYEIDPASTPAKALEQLKDPDGYVAGGAIQVLMKLEAKEAADEVENLSEDPRPQVRLSCMLYFYKLFPGEARSVQLMRRRLKDAEPFLVKLASEALRTWGAGNSDR